MKLFAAFATGVLITASAAVAAPVPAPVEHFAAPAINGRAAPFSSAVRVGEMLYLSGQIGIAPDGKLPPTFDGQARQAMDNIGGVLKARGLGWGNVVKCTVMLDNMSDWPGFNQVYVTYFPDGKFPARSAFGADGLALGAMLEVECLAYGGKT
jgi:2-iminobutanoate/2-iminopropanoate deaminase